MFFLARCSGLCHALVQLLDAFLQCCDGLGESGDGLLRVIDRLREVLDFVIKSLHLVLSFVDLLLAVHLLRVVSDLLLPEQLHHVIDHLDDFGEANFAALEGHRDERDAVVLALASAAGSVQDFQSIPSHLYAADSHLQQRGARQRLLEELQGVVIVQDPDSVRQGQQLLRPHLAPQLPLRLLLSADIIHVCKELLILNQ